MTGSRWVECPRCGRRVRLTARELEDKRGFCASCDARFELGPEMHLGDGPGRELVHVPATLAITQPPSKHLLLRSASPVEVELCSTRSPVVSAFAAVAGVLFVVVAIVLTASGVPGALMSWLVPGVLANIAWRWRPAREVVTVEPGRISVRRGKAQVSLDVGDKVDLAVGPDALIASTDARSLAIGGGLGLFEWELRWLREAIRDAIRLLPAGATREPGDGDDA